MKKIVDASIDATVDSKAVRRLVFSPEQLKELYADVKLFDCFFLAYEGSPEDPILVLMAVARAMRNQLKLAI